MPHPIDRLSRPVVRSIENPLGLAAMLVARHVRSGAEYAAELQNLRAEFAAFPWREADVTPIARQLRRGHRAFAAHWLRDTERLVLSSDVINSELLERLEVVAWAYRPLP